MKESQIRHFGAELSTTLSWIQVLSDPGVSIDQ